jgi:hypothetical protein
LSGRKQKEKGGSKMTKVYMQEINEKIAILKWQIRTANREIKKHNDKNFMKKLICQKKHELGNQQFAKNLLQEVGK